MEANQFSVCTTEAYNRFLELMILRSGLNCWKRASQALVSSPWLSVKCTFSIFVHVKLHNIYATEMFNATLQLMQQGITRRDFFSGITRKQIQHNFMINPF